MEFLVREFIPLGSWRWVTTERQKNSVTETGVVAALILLPS